MASFSCPPATGAREAAELPKDVPRQFGRFKTIGVLGAGSCGQVFEAVDTKTGEHVALKTISARRQALCRCLGEECEAYASLSASGATPRMRWMGKEGEHRALAMDLLGPSLRRIIRGMGVPLTACGTAQVAEELITVLERIHQVGLVHGDVKPDNFCVGRGAAAGRLFAVDLGLSQRYCDRRTFKHLPFVKGKGFSGTVSYASLAAHEGAALCRRDDLESLGYLLIHLHRGELPWPRGLTRDDVHKRKKELKLSAICAECPDELEEYLRYCRGLRYDAAPDYECLRGLFRRLAARHGAETDARPFWAPELDSDSDASTEESMKALLERRAEKIHMIVARRRKRDIVMSFMCLA